MGSSISLGIPDTVLRQSSPGTASCAKPPFTSRPNYNRPGSSRATLKRGSSLCSIQPFLTTGARKLLINFVVPKKGGGHRPIINLKPLNGFIPYEHKKMESIHMLKDLLRKGDYMAKIDLKNAYLTVPVWKND